MSFFSWLTKLKAPNYTARAGQVIAGNLARGGDGKFTSAGNASTPAAKPKPKNPNTAGNQKKVMAATRAGGIGPKSFGVMNAIRDGKTPDAKTLAILAKSGLVTADGKLTPAGKKFMAAADKGDAKGARAAVRAAKPGAKPKPTAKPPTKLGAKPKPTKPVAAKPKPATKPVATKKPVTAKPVKPPAVKPKPATQPVKKPAAVVAKPVKAADPAKAAERQAATEDRKKRQAEGDARRAAADKRRADRDAERAKPKPPKEPAKGGGGGGGGDKKSDSKSPADQRAKDLTDKLSAGEPLAPEEEDELIRNGFAKRGADGKLTLTSTGQSKRKEAPALAVFKDASGRYRWILRTATAFQDRDEEIVSTKALQDDVDRADADGNYGPLRWWHIPGVDIGDCDFNMLFGRTLIESGTFRDDRIGAAVARKAADLEASQGFLHPPHEPIGGIYHTIRRFERSLVPKGFASNLFTGLAVVQEKNMPTLAEKVKAFFAVIDNDEAVAQVLAHAQAQEKDAEQRGIASKSADVEALKADEAAMAAEDAAVEVEDEEAVDGPYVSDMTVDEYRALMQEIMSSVMTGASAETTKATGEIAQRFKAFEEKQAADDKTRVDQIAKLKETLTALQMRLAELEGDQPRALQARRASQQEATVTQNAALKAAVPQPDPTNEFLSFIVGNGQQ